MKKIKGVLAFSIIMLGALMLLISNCKKDEQEPMPTLSTLKVSRITDNSAVTCGCVSLEEGGTIIAKGVCWCTSASPTINDKFTAHGADTGSFSCNLTELTPNTTYHVRAYATNGDGTHYGDEATFTTPPTMTDADGNIYHTVIIGTQVWMAENLKTTHYRNGDEIPNVTSDGEWAALTTGACCDYSNRPDLGEIYGKIYNNYAMFDSRNIAPVGWHVPSDAEWKILEGTVDLKYPVGHTCWDGTDIRGWDAGGKLKSTSEYWIAPNSCATDEAGFSMLPAGGRKSNGSFIYAGEVGFLPSCTLTENGKEIYYRGFYSDRCGIGRYVAGFSGGSCIRFIKD